MTEEALFCPYHPAGITSKLAFDLDDIMCARCGNRWRPVKMPKGMSETV